MDKKKYISQLKEISLAFLKRYGSLKMNQHQKDVYKSIRFRAFGCQTQNAKQFAEAFMQIDFPIMKDTDYLPGMILVPIKNPNSHDYKIDEPTCVISSPHGFRLKTADMGNSLPDFECSVRFATEEEINEFYRKVAFKKCWEPFACRMNRSGNIPYVR